MNRKAIVDSVNTPVASGSTAGAALPARHTTLLLIVTAMGVLLRIGSALLQGSEVQALPGIFDQISYDALARRLITGYGFSFAQDHWPLTRAGEPTAHWSYLYTLFLTAIYGLVGTQPLVARLLQAVLAGVLHCWLAWRIGRRIGGEAVGLLAALLSAGYIYFFYYAGALMTETFYIIGILWTLDCALRLADAEHHTAPGRRTAAAWGRWLELGAAIGVTVLLRQVLLLFVPFLYAWLWWVQLGYRQPLVHSWRHKLAHVLLGTTLSGLIVFLLIAPWTARNYSAFGMFVPLNTNSGYAFFWGNHPIYGTRFVGILPANGPSYQDLIPPELRHLNEAELDQALLKEGIGFILDDPMRYLLLSFSRTREYFKFWPSPDSSWLSNIARVGSFGVLLPFMLYGLWLGIRLMLRPQHALQRPAILLLLLFAAVYSSIHLLTWALIRYRLPVDAVLILFAALSMSDLLQRLDGRGRWLSEPSRR